MYHDVQTLTDANASGWDKAWALGDLTASVIMDINMLDGAGEAMQAARIGAQIAEKGAIDVSEMAGKDAAKVVEECVAGGLSFVATTMVATRVGEQAIGTLKVGEKVWAYNPNTRKMEMQPILHVWINHDHDLVDLTITPIMHDKTKKPSSEVIHTNQKHPFLTVEKGFLPVGKIKLGMHVVEANGKVGMVSGWKVVPGVKVMYNLEVAHDHTFVVGVGMWVVHNCGITGNPDPANNIDEPGGNLYKGQQVDDNNLSNNGWTTSPKRGGQDNIGFNESEPFQDYLKANGRNPSDWEYRMKTWVKGNARIDNHYWSNPLDENPDFIEFHHH